MAYLPKSMVEKNIKTRVRKDRRGNEHTDYEAYVGIDPFSGKPVRITRSDIKELGKALADWYSRHRTGGDAAVRLTASQAIDAKNAYDALASAGLRISLTDAVTSYIDGKSVANKSMVSVNAAWQQYYASKPDGFNKHNILATTGKWVSTCATRNITDITAKEVAEYLETNFGERKPKTYNQNLLYLKVFFNWCCKDEIGYLRKSPIKRLESRPEPWVEPRYMSPKDAEALLRLMEQHKTDHPEWLAFVVASFFCGCRSIEIYRMASDPDAAKISIENETVRIAKAKGYQQGKRPRAFHIHPTALAWMQSFNYNDALHKITNTTQKEVYDIAREHSIPVFQNCGRHTFITYHVAAHEDPAKTQAMVGTSERMRAENYCGLATKADGESFFSILPSSSS